MYKLGFRPQEHNKAMYYDGHERKDIFEYREKYIKEITSHLRLSQTYDNDDLLVENPLDIGEKRQTIMIYHDESTIHANERPSRAWLLPNTPDFRSKSAGRLIHISDFILETSSTGRLYIDSTEGEPEEDAAVVIYPGSKGDKWWDCEQLIAQVKNKAIPIFERLHPSAQGVWIFDCSSAHESFGPSALRVQNMNLAPGGKQARLCDTIIPTDNPLIPIGLRGQCQVMQFPPDHPDPKLANQPKGVRQVLLERGVWDHYNNQSKVSTKSSFPLQCSECKRSGVARDAKTRAARLLHEAENIGVFVSESAAEELHPEVQSKDCCASQVLARHSDLAREKPLLQMIIEEAGHICIFLPKFHCELNPIELFWSYIKHRTFFCEHILS